MERSQQNYYLNQKNNCEQQENFDFKIDENLLGIFRILLKVDRRLHPENYKFPDNQNNNQNYD